ELDGPAVLDLTVIDLDQIALGHAVLPRAVRKHCVHRQPHAAGSHFKTANLAFRPRIGQPSLRQPRSAIDLTSRTPGPVYRARGRMSRLLANCSMMWADQPVIRLMTKIGV